MNATSTLSPLALVIIATGSSCSITTSHGGYQFDYKGETSVRSEQGSIEGDAKSIEVDHRFGHVNVVLAAPGEPATWDWQVTCWANSEAIARQFAEATTLSVTTGESARWALDVPANPGRALRGVESVLTLKLDRASPVTVTNRHGNVKLANIEGALRVHNEHGDVLATGTSGGKFDVRHGELELGAIRGDVTIAGAHGDVATTGIDGRIEIDRSHSDLNLSATLGPIEATGNHSRWTIEGAAALTLAGSHGRLGATGILGNVTIDCSHMPISIESTGNRQAIESRHGDVSLTCGSPDLETVAVEIRHGDLDIAVRSDVDGAVWATAEHGDIESDLPLNTEDSSGGTRITCQLTHGDLRVKQQQQ